MLCYNNNKKQSKIENIIKFHLDSKKQFRLKIGLVTEKNKTFNTIVINMLPSTGMFKEKTGDLRLRTEKFEEQKDVIETNTSPVLNLAMSLIIARVGQ